MKKLAIFDFDGTLFNTVDDVIICFNEALTINKFPTLTYEEYIHEQSSDDQYALQYAQLFSPQSFPVNQHHGHFARIWI